MSEERPESAAAPMPIRTPDQRVRVFVSSTLQELAPERAAARQAISRLRLSPVLFELGARPHPPQDLYRAYLAQSDIFVGLYWERYGWVAPTMEVSGLEDEYLLSGAKPKLIYIKAPAPNREPRLETLLGRIRDDDCAAYQRFTTPAELAELIENDLALLLTERFERVQQAQAAQIQQAPAPPRRPQLPAQRSALVDRERESTELRDLLTQDAVGLVTLTGPGGAGKTRLALHVAAEVEEQFSDGVYFVQLANLTSADQVASALVKAVDARESAGSALEALQDFLRDKRALLVLDNFEQVVDAAPILAELLMSCPRLAMLVTSRRALRLRGEQEAPVAPLGAPDPSANLPLEDLVMYPAVELFVRRVREAKPGFTLTRANAKAVAQICARLDGLPLAIELAAARIKVLPPAALLARLERSLSLLTGGARDLPARQQTMQDAISWSYDQLAESEKKLFWRIAVTSGGRTLEAAEAIADIEGDLDTLAGMESLVEVNLVNQEEGPGGEPRFRFLQIIREFAQERMKESGEEQALRARHAEFFLNLAEEAAPYLTSAARWEWIERLGADYWNFVAALAWSLANHPEWCLRLAGALGWFWFVRGYVADGRSWVERALAATDPAERTAERAQALHWAAGLAFAQGDFAAAQEPDEQSVAIYRELAEQRGLAYGLHLSGAIVGQRGGPEALPALEESVKLFRAVGDRWGLALAIAGLGDGVTLTGDLARAHTLYEESLALYQEQGDIWGRATVLQSLALLVWTEGDLAAAGALYEESAQLARTLGDKWDLARALTSAAAIALQRGDLEGARAQAAEALRLWRELGNRPGVALALGGLAGIAAVEGDAERSGRLFGVARSTLASGAAYYITGGVDVEAQITAARGCVDASAFDSAMEASKSRPLAAAVALALSEDQLE
jgi:predicted ATPase